MKIRIKETGAFKYLDIRDKNGIDYARDLTCDDDAIIYNEVIECYETNQDNYDWWVAVINREIELIVMVDQIKEYYWQHEDKQEIYDKIDQVCADNADEMEINAIRQMEALKEEFAEALK